MARYVQPFWPKLEVSQSKFEELDARRRELEHYLATLPREARYRPTWISRAELDRRIWRKLFAMNSPVSLACGWHLYSNLQEDGPLAIEAVLSDKVFCHPLLEDRQQMIWSLPKSAGPNRIGAMVCVADLAVQQLREADADQKLAKSVAKTGIDTTEAQREAQDRFDWASAVSSAIQTADKIADPDGRIDRAARDAFDKLAVVEAMSRRAEARRLLKQIREWPRFDEFAKAE